MSQLAAGSVARAVVGVPDHASRVGDWLPALEEVSLFEGLSKHHLRRIAKLARIRRFASGSVMVRAGDAGTSFFIMLEGTARVLPVSGRTRRLSAGDSFGEMALLDGAPRSADVVADGAVLALTIGRSSFGKLLRKEPALTQALLRTLAARLRTAERPRTD
jgi:CRP/FNR family cyclic AMP-dependent transcriptional regulator